jgi:hypothetical protein
MFLYLVSISPVYKILLFRKANSMLGSAELV